MDRFAGAGKTRSRSVSAEDVTDYYFDLEGRLRNKRILEERYRDYLRKAQSVEDMLAVEARLSETTNDIERLEGAFRDLGDRIDLATLSLSLRAAKAADPSRPTLGESLGRLFAGLADAFRLAVVALVGLVVYGVPAILAIAAMWWLAFGRVGLVRRLFSLADLVALAGEGRLTPAFARVILALSSLRHPLRAEAAASIVSDTNDAAV